tara:strand:+ start:562 stop:759 length:198 start_codon:yes stop_codon:yes gene_type:complete
MKEFNDIKRDRDNLEHMPDQRKHQLVSFVKSGIRITGYCFIPFNLWVACLILLLSEVVGIFEELV